jgi:hypothetical protein
LKSFLPQQSWEQSANRKPLSTQRNKITTRRHNIKAQNKPETTYFQLSRCMLKFKMFAMSPCLSFSMIISSCNFSCPDAFYQ